MATHTRPYIGRFAPSPSGPLHQGSLVAAMASYLDARAHQGTWLLRIEDIDTSRAVAGADRWIMGQLQALGMQWDGEPVWQTDRHPLYQQAFDRLRALGRVYGCRCTRASLAKGPYPGTCRPNPVQTDIGAPDTAHTAVPSWPRHPQAGTGTQAPGQPRRARTAAQAAVRSWRFQPEPGIEIFVDRWQGPQSQDVATEVGDFIIRRADDLWAYQLVVVVDDGDQQITDIVRGADLLDSSARQRQLARALGLPCPRLLHVPLLRDTMGRKLSKQNHAPALDLGAPMSCLNTAWQALGFEPVRVRSTREFWPLAISLWDRRLARDDTRLV
ncbi:MAG TPA: tRNA glutamyl-Q(34) synthetase GluQRS [Castellaniella sp.]|nr:tRNA glutamyl-Q(34) synthetase GluQRS [Castellaniella sp.]